MEIKEKVIAYLLMCKRAREDELGQEIHKGQFAEFIDAPGHRVRSWMNPNMKDLPTGEYVIKLANIFTKERYGIDGGEIYDILGWPRPTGCQ